MSSTRNLNSRYDYLCKKKESKRINDYMLNNCFSEQLNTNVRMFDLGTGPVKAHSSNFSHNNIDIESALRGTRSTALEGDIFNPELNQKSFISQSVFDNTLKDQIYMPNPFLHNSNERTGFHNL